MDEIVYDAWMNEIENEANGFLINGAAAQVVGRLVEDDAETFINNVLQTDERIPREAYRRMIGDSFAKYIEENVDPAKQWYLYADKQLARRIVDGYVEKCYDNDYGYFLLDIYRIVMSGI